ncbi:MAG: HNH endonuclease [Desulfurellales bacterium]|nr:MAG: HNH endonuclease [Desulfurellales bacterium]
MDYVYGDPRLPERFWNKVAVQENGCWLWTGAKCPLGYGKFRLSNPRKLVFPHVHAFQVLVGEVLPGLELDHLCRCPSCVNPGHLDPVTHQVNMQRSAPATKAHCANGHEYTPENTYMEGNKRHCRACRLKKIACLDCGTVLYAAGMARHRKRLHLAALI